MSRDDSVDALTEDEVDEVEGIEKAQQSKLRRKPTPNMVHAKKALFGANKGKNQKQPPRVVGSYRKQ